MTAGQQRHLMTHSVDEKSIFLSINFIIAKNICEILLSKLLLAIVSLSYPISLPKEVFPREKHSRFRQ